MIDERLYSRLVDLIYEKTGILFADDKEYFVERRVMSRMARLGIDDFQEYYFRLKFADDNALEWQELINSLTINETYFFRDFPQLAGFAEDIIPYVIREKEKKGLYQLKLWSAGCATGEEPYTLAIILLEMLPEPELWDIEILATDIDTRVLGFARRGIYGERSIKDVPPEYLSKYFRKHSDKYAVIPELKKMVTFEKLNLADNQEMQRKRGFDFIFCRNVLIYFGSEKRRKVLEHFYEALNPGGFIFLGHSEQVSRFSSRFTAVKINETLAYRKGGI